MIIFGIGFVAFCTFAYYATEAEAAWCALYDRLGVMNSIFEVGEEK